MQRKVQLPQYNKVLGVFLFSNMKKIGFLKHIYFNTNCSQKDGNKTMIKISGKTDGHIISFISAQRQNL